MALVKLSGLITDISGSLGGTTFQRSRSGLIIKNKPTGFHANTVKRNNQTNIMHYLQSEWRSLSESTHTTWETFALFKKVPQKKNPNLFLSGHQIYLKYNFYRLLSGLAVQNTCSYSFSKILLLTITMCLVGPGLAIIGSRNFNAATEFLILFITYPCSVSLNNPGSRYRYIYVPYSSGASIVITPWYEGVFGRLPVVGETVFFKYRLVDVVNLFVLPWSYAKTTFK